MEASINKGRASVNIPWWSVGLHEHLTSLEGFFFVVLIFLCLCIGAVISAVCMELKTDSK